MTRYRYYVDAVPYTQTPGIPTLSDVVVVLAPDGFDYGVADFSTNLALLVSAAIEGTTTDFNFQPHRFQTAMDPHAGTWKAWKEAFSLWVVASTEGLGTALTIRTVAPVFPPLPGLNLGTVLGLPAGAWEARHLGHLHAVGKATSDAPGTWVHLLPADAYSRRVCELLSEIQRHMLLVPDAGVTWDVWTSTEVLKRLNERVKRFLMETGLVRSTTRIPVVSATRTVDLPQTLLDTRRAAWVGNTHTANLQRIDHDVLDFGTVGWESTSGTPYSYVEEPLAPLTIELVDNPSADGEVELIFVKAPDESTLSCSPLDVPAIYIPYVKYGVMADLLSKEGEANDPERAAYAEKRYQEGVELAKALLGSET